MESRPRITLTHSPLDRAVEWLCAILLGALWVLTIYVYFDMPQTIPTHFNAMGEPDAYGDKGTLFILAVLGTLIYAGMTALNKIPHVFNYLTTITAENAREQYILSTRMLRFIKLMVLFIFNSIVLYAYFSSTGEMKGAGSWFLPIIFSFLLLPLIYLVIHLARKNKK